MARTYYAASLRGTNPGAIENVYSFEDYRQREDWLVEGKYRKQEENRTKISAKIAKKHVQVKVTLEQVLYYDGSSAWVWHYDGLPE